MMPSEAALELWRTIAEMLDTASDSAIVDIIDRAIQQVVQAERIREYLLDQPWHKRCEIISDYMPPHPSKDTRPTVQIRYNDGSDYPPFLRHSIGPKQGFFWDIYGDDFQNEALAVIALSQAPYPVYVGPITLSIPISSAPATTKEDR